MNAWNGKHCLLYWETSQAVVECKWSSSGRSAVRSSPSQGSTMFWTVPPSKHSSITGRSKSATCAFYLLSLFSEKGLVSSPLFTLFDNHELMSTQSQWSPIVADAVPHEMYSSPWEFICLKISHLCVRHEGSLPITKNLSTGPSSGIDESIKCRYI
jgi:hypothetical protein